MIPETTELILIRALKEIIDQSIPIMNKYGIISYLRESQNLYFLVDNYEIKHSSNSFLLALYNAMPVIKEEMSFKNYVTYFEHIYLTEKLRKLSALNIPTILSEPSGKEALSQSFKSFDLVIQERLLESFIVADQQELKVNEDLRVVFLDIYKKFVYTQQDTIISSLLSEDYDILRCYDIKTELWSDCSKEKIEEFDVVKVTKKASLKDNPYGYYGRRDTKGKFKIVTVRQNVRIAAATGKIDARISKRKGEGQVCGTGQAFSAIKLIGMFIRFGEIAESRGEPAPDIIPKLNARERERVINEATPSKVKVLLESYRTKAQTLEADTERKAAEKTKKKGEDDEKGDSFVPTISSADVDTFSASKLQRLYAILQFSGTKYLCPTLAEWFEHMGLWI